jgi:hypothetical protein
MAQADAFGNVNVSRFGQRLAGSGGFINISQNAKRLVFLGTFATPSRCQVHDGLVVVGAGVSAPKFLAEVEQRTFSGAHADLDAIRIEVEARLADVGRKVQMVVNYDNFHLATNLTDAYVAVVRGLTERFYASVTRYTTSAFLRLKLGSGLAERGLAPHVYESRAEALRWLQPPAVLT